MERVGRKRLPKMTMKAEKGREYQEKDSLTTRRIPKKYKGFELEKKGDEQKRMERNDPGGL